ncbi:phage gp6-like head-tail connector protein [Micromonospora sp. NBC_01655]|uniref:phage gp6-like head-tail connector protein n=1 Tax=Micromonospora sp. NBC_01655 TaxID=2975983 RepID=UPI002250CE42|nr:phage gp6-like head-tail connector protein [Micromonospora sp. NBC_01655]MCX4468963.1 phage gp6-like head-tail connector protein [Micromonospora sp. NBC_01655]
MTSPTPADRRYASLERLKASLKLDPAGPDDRDELLTEALDVASRQIDKTCNRRGFWLDTTATTREYRTIGRVVAGDDGDALLVDDVGDLSGLAVMLRASPGSTWEQVTDWDTEPCNALADGRPVTLLRRWRGWQGDRVRVTALHGWPAVPAEVAMACRMQALRLYKRKDSPEGVLGSADWGVTRVARVDPDVAALLRDFVLEEV